MRETSQRRLRLKEITTGETLCEPKHPITLERMEFPEPVISIAGGTEDAGGSRRRLGIALSRSSRMKIPSFRVSAPIEESGQTIISGMGELHLEIIIDRLLRRVQGCGECGQSAGRVPRDDSLEQWNKRGTDFVRQTGGRGQYGHVWLRIEPLGVGIRATNSMMRLSVV